MESRGSGLTRRLATFVAVIVVALGLAGDRGRAASVPATVYGQDPLEVLELKVRPNVIVVLDSSGSMTGTTDDVETGSGDHPRSKIYQAKQVIKQVVQNNQDKVSFQFGTYTQNSITLLNQAASATGNRFQYATTAAIGASLLVRGARGDTLGRGLQSWQIIKPEWRRLYFGEQGGTICYAEVSGTPRFFQQGADLASELTARMNAATCTAGARANSYTVTYATATGIFTITRNTGGTKTFNIRWADAPYSIRGALGRRATGNTALGTGAVASAAPYRLLYRAATGNSGGEMSTTFALATTTGGVTTTFYQAAAGRLWNGEVIRVQTDGTVCGLAGLSPAPTLTNPPSLTLQLVANNCGADTAGSVASFTFAGAAFDRAGGGGDGCSGFRSKSSLIPCDLQSPPAATQVAQIAAYVDDELPFQASGLPADLTTQGAAVGSANYGVPDGVPDYVEYADGSWQVQSIDIAPSAKAGGYTPIANSLIDIKGTADPSSTDCIVNAPPASGKLDSVTVASTFGACVERNFSKLWNQGQAGSTSMAGPGPWQLDPIKDHRDPKEKTIVLFVTDGDDTCGTRLDAHESTNMDNNALRAAYAAQLLYTRIDANEPASSVQTYAIGYGGAFSAGVPYRLNWIAWGGSGLGQGLTGQPAVGNNGTRWTDSSATLTSSRAQCTTCIDAFVAPDAATLATQLQSIIDQGASDGDFNAQQSITESVFEYVDIATGGGLTFDARSPSSRYEAIVPTRFVSSFTLPGFKGQLRAYQNDGPYLANDPCDGSGQCKWSAGDKLLSKVSTAMSTCNTGTAGGAANMCVFSQLHGGATDANIAGSAARIKRRIYSTDRNGVYAFTPTTLMAGTAASRVVLWPPPAAIAPTDYTSPGSLDKALGLPDNTPTCTLLPAYANCTAQWTAQLQAKYKACQGSNMQAANCGSTTPLTKLKAIRRESRDMILAFMAGAAPVAATGGLARTSAAVGSSPVGSLLYQSRSWLLADSELATGAVVTFPNQDEPSATPYLAEYKLFKDGSRNSAGQNPDSAGTQIKQGFGLTQPDNDHTVATGGNDTRTALKPVMTVLYQPANDMLHAFRAGPNCTPAKSGCAETGGEELWGFVPYDQLGTLGLRLANEPQGRNNHVFMLARGVRFGDVFVPGTLTNVNIGGVTVASMNGVWRRILYFGRGIGGKYVTALDVTAPGAYTDTALNTLPPIPLWNRGNPDTQDGSVTGTVNNTAADQTAYSHMGETWSVPTLAYVNKDKTNPIYATARRPAGIDFALFMGSGYGAAGEGTTHYTLDALSGDVIAAVDVETTAAANGLTRTGLSYTNALVANSVSFNRVINDYLVNAHPWSYESTRVYVGDLHGRLWKFLSARPDVAIPVADLGADQPIATAVALITRHDDTADTKGPFIFVTAGADRRAAGPFRNFSLRDDGTDTALTTTGTTTDDGVTTFAPAAKQFARTFDQGNAEANCGYTAEALFRGTVQPSGTFECTTPITNGKCQGTTLWRVFFAGTRLSLPNTKFAPPTPLACSTGEYPCRSQFDSIVYALGAETGNPAYDLNASGDDAYRVFRDSRIAAIGMAADPDPNRAGSSFVADEGLMKGTPTAPPPPGVPPNAQTATANVIFVREPGQPEPTIHYGSSVCQQ